MRNPDVAEVLAAVNEIRAAHDMPPIDRIPCGTHSGYDCPIARSFGSTDESMTVYAGTTRITHRVHGWSAEYPPPLRQFVLAFDAGQYPSLDVETAR